MRTFLSFLVRAICAAATGYLLVMYRTEMVQWITIAVGVLFFVSGLFSVLAYFVEKRKAQTTAERLKAMAELHDGKDAPQNADDIVRAVRPSFPIVGIGSIILGALLALMPTEFVQGAMYALAALLILGGLNQLYNLFNVRQLASVPFIYWLLPCVVLGVGVFMVVKPLEIVNQLNGEIIPLPFRIIGWGLILYAVVELINGIKISRIRSKVEKSDSKTEADPITAIEKKDEDIEEAIIIEE
ncbi:MAG: DUF308 domain-containing protein [Prevotella sp.]|nr:DUF308 domain-containing protein [Prevotella sp.]